MAHRSGSWTAHHPSMLTPAATQPFKPSWISPAHIQCPEAPPTYLAAAAIGHLAIWTLTVVLIQSPARAVMTQLPAVAVMTQPPATVMMMAPPMYRSQLMAAQRPFSSAIAVMEL